MHDQTAIKTEGIEELLWRYDAVHATVDAGDQGLAKAFSGRVHAPPTKPAKNAPPEELEAWQQARKQQSSQRICVEHANAEHKQWRALQRWIGRREHYAETTWPSPGWSPTGQPAADHHQPRSARPARPNLNRAPSRNGVGLANQLAVARA
jgi:hypothetical protein